MELWSVTTCFLLFIDFLSRYMIISVHLLEWDCHYVSEFIGDMDRRLKIFVDLSNAMINRMAFRESRRVCVAKSRAMQLAGLKEKNNMKRAIEDNEIQPYGEGKQVKPASTKTRFYIHHAYHLAV